jgi:hypothetical protein
VCSSGWRAWRRCALRRRQYRGMRSATSKQLAANRFVLGCPMNKISLASWTIERGASAAARSFRLSWFSPRCPRPLLAHSVFGVPPAYREAEAYVLSATRHWNKAPPSLISSAEDKFNRSTEQEIRLCSPTRRLPLRWPSFSAPLPRLWRTMLRLIRERAPSPVPRSKATPTATQMAVRRGPYIQPIHGVPILIVRDTSADRMHRNECVAPAR